ncbi:hypothetical protein NMY22_g9947 [Coprinellus aureogranulatus]|nr:hypothetical protein NMY22_g9947 [Coprinellus aureogranulatus]
MRSPYRGLKSRTFGWLYRLLKVIISSETARVRGEYITRGRERFCGKTVHNAAAFSGYIGRRSHLCVSSPRRPAIWPMWWARIYGIDTMRLWYRLREAQRLVFAMPAWCSTDFYSYVDDYSCGPTYSLYHYHDFDPYWHRRCPQLPVFLLVKKAGDWTGRLSRLAASNRYQERQGELEPEEKAARHRDVESLQSRSTPVRVWIEGPYGGCGRTVFSSFSGALIVCGGSGISFGLSILQDLVAKDAVGESRLKYVELIWVVPEQQHLDGSVLPELMELVDESDYNRSRNGHGRLEVKVNISYTRAATPSGTAKFKRVLVSLAKSQSSSSPMDMDLDLEDVDVSTRPVGVHPGVVVSPGRPKVGKALDNVMSRAAVLNPGDPENEERNGMKGVVVGVCGPSELGAEVVKAVAAVAGSRRDRVGGIEVHEETFGIFPAPDCVQQPVVSPPFARFGSSMVRNFRSHKTYSAWLEYYSFAFKLSAFCQRSPVDRQSFKFVTSQARPGLNVKPIRLEDNPLYLPHIRISIHPFIQISFRFDLLWALTPWC